MLDPAADLQYLKDIWFVFKTKFDEIIQQEPLTKDVTIQLLNFTNEEEPLQILVGGKGFLITVQNLYKGSMSFGFLNHMRDISSTAGIGEWREKAKKFITNNLFSFGKDNTVSIYNKKPKFDKLKIQTIFHEAFTEATNAVYLLNTKIQKPPSNIIVKATVIDSRTSKPIKAK